MIGMRQHAFLGLAPSGFHAVNYYEWGAPDNPRVVVCAHGLTRNGRDFDFLAQRLAGDFRVVCPDVAGRGKSEWLANPADYVYPTYVNDMVALMARLDTSEVYWVGTSMGGIIGMILASMPKTPIRKLVLNDVGIHIPKAALARIAMYVGKDPVFDTFEQFEEYMREVSAPFGPLTDDQWWHLAMTSARIDAQGRTRFIYDPDIGEAFRSGPIQDVDLSPYWKAVQCPVLLIRGEGSDLFFGDTFEAMLKRPNTQGVEVPGVGHAPMLLSIEQTEPVERFLRG